MYPPEYKPPFALYAGDVWVQQFRFRDDDGELADMTGVTFESDWKRNGFDPLVSLGVVKDDVEATITLTATAEQTRLMQGRGTFDIQGSDGKTWLRGYTTWTEDITP